MTPFAAYLPNQQILHAVLRQNGSLAAGCDDSTKNAINPCFGRSGVYFNNHEVPQEMHIPASSPQSAPADPRLPSGKPMPRPPRLMMTALGINATTLMSSKVSNIVARDKRKHGASEEGERQPTKRVRHNVPSAALTSEQCALIEAALALASVKASSAGRKSPSNITPMASPKSKLPSALPPPPFRLPMKERVKIAGNLRQRQNVAKSA